MAKENDRTHVKELVRRLSEGSEEAFNLLFHQYEKRLYAFAIKLLPHAEDAEEVVQEVFYKVWKNRALLDEDKCFKSFIFTVGKNYIYNLLSKRVSQSTYKHYMEGKKLSYASTTEDTLVLHELQNNIQSIMNAMPEKRKKVFIMSRFEGLKNHEIAEQLGISLSTVENHINKALKALKQRLTVHEVHILLIMTSFYV